MRWVGIVGAPFTGSVVGCGDPPAEGSGALKRERAESTQGEFSIIFQTVENCRDELFARATPNSIKIKGRRTIAVPWRRSYVVATVSLRSRPSDFLAGFIRPNIDSNVACGSPSR